MRTSWLINNKSASTIKQVLINLNTSYLGILLTVLAITSISISNFLNFLAVQIDMDIDKQKSVNLAYEVLNTFFIYKVAFYIFIQFRYMLSSPILETFKVTISQKLYTNFILTNESANFGKIQVLIENTTSGMSRIADILFFDILNYSVSSILSFKTINSLFGAKYNALIFMMITILLILEYTIVKLSTILKDKMIKAAYKLNQQLRETDHNMDVIRAHRLITRESTKYTTSLLQYRKAKIWYDVASAAEGSIFPIVFTCFRFFIVYLFLQSDLDLEAKNKDIRYLGVLMNFIYDNLRSFTLLYTNFKVNVVQCEDGVKLLNKANNANKIKQFIDGEECRSEFNRIDIQGLKVYKQGFEKVYGHLKVNKGDKMAIIGANGTGKTTFIKELFKLKNHQGILVLDLEKNGHCRGIVGRNVKMAYVPQKIQLFKDTLMGNIEGGYNEQLASLYKYFRSIDGDIGDFGERLSKGKQQLLQIIRALSRDSDIILMDEPLVFLDNEIKKMVMDCIFNSEKTMIICTHNKELIERCIQTYELK
eukprot:GAHX01000916.1.p1 GENE.GAHX01000916.1~~GAHX01000916.1.p1  ORF type:complete len:536 (+),score=91.23 GAHX01000916.1:911-2518(+)